VAALTPARLLRTYYFTNFGAFGAIMPFLPLLFDARGLTPTQISHVMLLGPISSMLVPPLWGLLADALRARVVLLRVASLGGAASLMLLCFDWKVAGSFLAMSIIYFFRAAIAPLADTAAAAMLGGGGRFSLIRAWGSLGFALFSGIGGWLDVSHHPLRLVALTSSLYFVSFLVTLKMDAPPLERQPKVLARTIRYLAIGPLPLLLFGTALHYVGQSIFDVYFSLHMRALHFDDSFVGLAWLVGVLCEVAMMFFAPRILAVYDARRVLLLCTAAAILRWSVTAVAVDRGVILLCQTLHALTFGLWYISTVKLVQDEAPEELRTSLQSAALTFMGLGALFGYLLGGSIYELEGGRTVFMAASVAAACATACYGLLAVRRTAA
jgi:PPP family 3-phenylpropionic acid transporter